MAVAFATVFLRGLFSVVTVYNAESCKSEKPRNNFPKLKTGEHCRSILSGVEVAGFDSVRSMVAQSPWSGLCSPFRANKLNSLSPVGEQPTGLTVVSFAPALQAACPNPCHRHTKIRSTRKGYPDFCVEVAGFEPAAFWSRIPGLPSNGLTWPFHALSCRFHA